MCIIKTSQTQFAAIRAALEKIHPYEVPELIATPIVDGSLEYLDWLRAQLGER